MEPSSHRAATWSCLIHLCCRGEALVRLEAAGATLVEVELPCVGDVDRQAILPTELLDFLGEPSLSLTPTSHVATLPC